MLSIVVPTYCESENIKELVSRIDKALTDYDYEVVIVDDNSPDDIVTVAAELGESFPVRIVQPRGRERDLSLSVIEGVQLAIGDHVVVMDADHSHPPEKIPELYERLLQDDLLAPSAFWIRIDGCLEIRTSCEVEIVQIDET